ncbi:hypothetical protein NF867_05430 [Solitalea sp. MAHUQ-68]|uniref:Uncharacterized protein n=1 Tax=Solitalea agri TaxID=2953739 RepID=A0A9X2JEE5_9SPHI|nr:hypothetical protein [Solitalea agri]MCO4292301.1 hypothetical protein [Solitalea agri]
MNTIFQFPPILENERIKLKPLELKHIDDLLEIALLPELWTVGVRNITSKDDLTKYISTAIT